MANGIPVTVTRYAELGLAKLGANDWRYVAREDGAPFDPYRGCTGPRYRSKLEALADLERFASEYGATGAAARDTQLRYTWPVLRLMLVYQAGIANVFKVDAFNLAPYGRNAECLLQHAFGPCEFFARGAAAAGALVRSAGCNQVGDISSATWTDDYGPFRDDARPVFSPTICEGCGNDLPAAELARYRVTYYRGGQAFARYCAGCAADVQASHDYIQHLDLAQ